MLRRPHRFKGHRLVRQVYRKGQTARSQSLMIKSLPTGKSESHFTVVVSKKVSKSAPRRNRIRRRLYELLRRYLGEIKPGYDVVLTVFDDVLADIQNDRLDRSVQDLLLQADLLNKK